MLYQEIRNEIEDVLNGKNCSEEFLEILKKHKCLYALSKVKNYDIKKSSYMTINQIVQNNRYTLCKEVLQELSEIPYAIIKGAVLSDRIYGKPYYRSSGDIDLLVAPKYTTHVKEILNNNGFIQGRVKDGTLEEYTREEILYYKLQTHQLASFEKKTDSVLCPFLNLDVNFGILWGESGQTIDIEEYLLHTEKRSLFGIEVSVLSPIYEFIALCLHHYKDMNSIYLLAERGICLNEFFDIYYYIVFVKPDIDELYDITEKYQVKEYVYYCIYFTNEIFRNPCLGKYLERLETPEGIRLLDCYGLADFERNKWSISFPDRLLDQDFKFRFMESLREEDIRKIRINKHFL